LLFFFAWLLTVFRNSSYNRINGVYACEQPVTLLAFKKMGFLGWMMSDWGATHSVSINQGTHSVSINQGFGFLSTLLLIYFFIPSFFYRELQKRWDF
jgi:hypothetical protein